MAKDNEQKNWEDNGWIIGGIILAVFGLVGGMFTFMERSHQKYEDEYAKREKIRLEQPIVDLRDGFIEVQELHCRPALKGYSKHQLSELTDEDKWLAKYATECGIVFQHVRIRKDRIRAYSPHFSILMWRNDDVEDPNGPLHVKKFNIEDCEVAVGGNTGEAKWMVIEGTCSLLDQVIR